jgi:hypothetical protein
MKSRRWTQMSAPGRSNGVPRFPRGRVDSYGGRSVAARLLPDAATLTFGTPICIARLPVTAQ